MLKSLTEDRWSFPSSNRKLRLLITLAHVNNVDRNYVITSDSIARDTSSKNNWIVAKHWQDGSRNERQSGCAVNSRHLVQVLGVISSLLIDALIWVSTCARIILKGSLAVYEWYFYLLMNKWQHFKWLAGLHVDDLIMATILTNNIFILKWNGNVHQA